MCDSIKRGTLVKAWNEDPSEYIIGEYFRKSAVHHLVLTVDNQDWPDFRINCVEIPEELAKQLEELGEAL